MLLALPLSGLLKMRRHWIEGTPPTGKDKMDKKDKERKKINTFILIREKLIRSLGTHFPIFLPRENGCTVSNHCYHIRCMEPSLREVLIPQVIWVFCMHTVMAMAQSPVLKLIYQDLAPLEGSKALFLFR